MAKWYQTNIEQPVIHSQAIYILTVPFLRVDNVQSKEVELVSNIQTGHFYTNEISPV